MSRVIIGYKETSRGQAPIKIKSPDRRHGTYVLGQTGTGKSSLVKHMVVQDLRSGAGVGVIDPHGQLVDDLLRYIPKHRTNKVIYFNPADEEHVLGFNALDLKPGQNKEVLTSHLVSVFRSIWHDAWGSRSQAILFNTVYSLFDTEEPATLIDVYRMLADQSFREKTAQKLHDPMARSYWEDTFSRYTDRSGRLTAFGNEAVAPIQTKTHEFIIGPRIRNIVGQPKSTIDLREIMDKKYIFLANLSKGRLGEDRANLLGSLLITKFFLAALQREDMPEDQRKDFYLYVDEFAAFGADTFPSILSEARKYRLCLTLIHQYLDQVSRDTIQAIFGNVGNWLIFRTGVADSQSLEQHFFPYIKAEQLWRSPNYRIIYRLLRDGVPTIPMSTTTPAPPLPQGDEADPATVIRVSQERYTRPRNQVEQEIKRRWELFGQP